MEKRTITAYMAAPWTAFNGGMRASAAIFTQGVFCGSQGCILHPAETVKNSTDLWRRIPVTLRHPHVDGAPVSVNHTPAVFNEFAIGHLENPRFEGGKLKGDIVITKRDPALWATLQKTRELSVGIFTEEIAARGIYADREYRSISQYIRPDHLAVLPEGNAAAGPWAGVGIGINQETFQVLQQVAMTALTHLMKGEFSMTEHATLYPPGVVEEPKINVNEILKDWEDFEGAMPAEIVALTSGQRPQAASHDDDDNRLLPPGVS